MEKIYTLELHEQEIQYLIVGLELFSLNLNSIWTLKKDSEQQELDYANVFLLYEYLISKIRYCNSIKLERPKNNILQFKK